ncbi:MAG: hypothetical protein ACD_12C00872G0003 [uncultured bacterium]|nr:MAG: hypothetical protein ACD_12C00872G0003 [uncultured bacterium]
MKKGKNNSANDLVTKEFLDKKLGESFDKNTSKIIKFFEMKFDIVDDKFEKINKKLEMLDSIMKTLDWLAKDYRDLKDENTVQTEQYRRLDGRVTTLEKRVFAS